MERLFRKILRRTTKRDVLRFTLDTVGVFCASTLIWEHCFTIQRSEGPSMYPTFHTRGDWLLISRFHRQGEGIQVGDVVRFYHPSFLGVNGAKRVLGMPGDFVCKDPPFSTDVGRGTTHTKEGTAAVVAAAAATEKEDKDGAMGEPEMIQVPEGHVFLGGDNLPWSRDSRNYGPVPLGLVNGKIIARVWPISKAQWVENTLQPAQYADVVSS